MADDRGRSRSRDRDGSGTRDWRRDDPNFEQPQAQSNTQGNNLYVTHLSQQTTEETLRSVFEKYGELESASVVKEPVTLNSRGFGFVAFKSPEDADRAIAELSGSFLDGKEIKVEKARRSTGYEKTPGRYLGPPQMSLRTGVGRRYDDRGGRPYRSPPRGSDNRGGRDYDRGPPPRSGLPSYDRGYGGGYGGGYDRDVRGGGGGYGDGYRGNPRDEYDRRGPGNGYAGDRRLPPPGDDRRGGYVSRDGYGQGYGGYPARGPGGPRY